MKYMKILTGLALAVFTAMPAQAQQYSTQSNFVWIVGSGTTNTAIVYGLQKYEDVTIQIHGRIGGAGTGTTTFNFHRGLDGVTFANTPVIRMELVNAGTIVTACISNLNMGAAGYLLLSNCVTASSDGSTNWVFISKKPQRFGR